MTNRIFKIGQSREQGSFLPPRIEDYVAPDNPVRAIDAYVCALDFAGLGFRHAEGDGGAGQPPDDPADLLKLFAQFKSDWPSGLFLSDRCAVRRVSARSDIFDLDRDDVTAAQIAVDRQIEHGEVPSAGFDLEFSPDRPDVFRSQRRLCSGHLALIPGHSLMRRGSRIQLILHGHTPRLQRARSMCHRLGLGRWNQVSFRAMADFASGLEASEG